MTYLQSVTRRVTGISDGAKIIDLDATCQFVRYSEESLGQVVPVVEEARAEVTVNGTFDIEFLLYPNDSYASPYSTLPSSVSTLYA